MIPTRVLLRLPVHITFFTRTSCGLCASARDVLTQAWERRPFEYTEIDVMTTTEKRWRDAYEFDVPVLHILPSAEVEGGEERGDGAVGVVTGKGLEGAKRKMMHRFSVDEVVDVLEEVERLAREGAGDD